MGLYRRKYFDSRFDLSFCNLNIYNPISSYQRDCFILVEIEKQISENTFENSFWRLNRGCRTKTYRVNMKVIFIQQESRQPTDSDSMLHMFHVYICIDDFIIREALWWSLNCTLTFHDDYHFIPTFVL